MAAQKFGKIEGSRPTTLYHDQPLRLREKCSSIS